MTPIQKCIVEKKTNLNPIWLMRQAGRYHKHYQNLKKKHTFEELCKTPELICETTMGPIKDFDFKNFHEGACIFTTEVENPEEFGVAEMDIDGKVLSIEEKPTNPKSNNAVVGLYMFDNSVFNKIDTLEPSARGEYEITDLCNIFVSENKCMNLNINGWWIDAGTPERIIELEEKLS